MKVLPGRLRGPYTPRVAGGGQGRAGPRRCGTLVRREGALSQTELELLRGDVVVRVIPVDERPVTLGRDLSNRVVLLDDAVSGHHAVVERCAEGCSVRDLGSTNGTTVNGEPVQRQVLAHGDRVGLGPDVSLRVRRLGSVGTGQLVLRNRSAGTAWLLGSRFVIGSAPDADARVASGPAHAAVLLIHDDGEVWLSLDEGDERAIDVGEGFEVGGATYVLELSPVDTALPPTARPMLSARYPYELTATLSGAAGPLAVLADPTTGDQVTLRSEQRVALLYVLGKQLLADRGERVLPPMAGWCHDEDVLVGVWGRQGLKGAASKYSVLLHRVRKELEAAGFDPWCIEKRRGATRLQVASVELS